MSNAATSSSKDYDYGFCFGIAVEENYFVMFDFMACIVMLYFVYCCFLGFINCERKSLAPLNVLFNCFSSFI